MLKIRSLIISLIFLSLFSVNSYSQNDSYNFLRLDVGARASSLGGSFVTNTGDVNALFYNPAALSTIQNTQAMSVL
ncbi:MAG: hypothetical protein IPM96_19820 [Ignavibacteria bacterium]|nr:hypothetical protein [Ignavibacteria bacterium]